MPLYIVDPADLDETEGLQFFRLSILREDDPMGYEVCAVERPKFEDALEAAERIALQMTRSGLVFELPPKDIHCATCGETMQIDGSGVSNHVKDGEIDYDADADHVAVSDENL